jgi:hypothetical protein
MFKFSMALARPKSENKTTCIFIEEQMMNAYYIPFCFLEKHFCPPLPHEIDFSFPTLFLK